MITEKELWENSCLTRWQVEHWDDHAFNTHAEGIRRTLKFLFQKLDEKDAGHISHHQED